MVTSSERRKGAGMKVRITGLRLSLFSKSSQIIEYASNKNTDFIQKGVLSNNLGHHCGSMLLSAIS